jgi:flagellar hook-length control protein FliK
VIRASVTSGNMAAVSGERRGVSATCSPLPCRAYATTLASLEDTQPSESMEIDLRLDPPELGTVRIHLRSTEEGVTARLVVQEETTRQLIEGQIHQLRQRLSDAGVMLTKFEVRQESDSGRQRSPQRPRRLNVGRPWPIAQVDVIV